MDRSYYLLFSQFPGIVVSKSLRIAGDDMDKAIAHYLRLRHGILLGEKTVEELKIKLGTAYERKKEKVEEAERVAVVRGRDIETGLPKSLRITEVEVREALAPVLSKIVDAIAQVLEESPPELTSDILEHGILLTGGGSILYGLDKLIIERIHIPVIRSEDPLTTVVRGGRKSIGRRRPLGSRKSYRWPQIITT